MIKSYSDLRRLATLEERFRYLALNGSVARATFGTERWMNQRFYTSREWRNLRDDIIVRDEGCELGVMDFPVHSAPHIHHMNPLMPANLINGDRDILNPEYLITCSQRVHNAIHYGDAKLLPQTYVERRPGDTKLW